MGVPEIARRFIDGAWKTSALDEDGGGGAQPVPVDRCMYAYSVPINMHLTGVNPLVFASAVDNTWASNPLTVLPSDIGLSFAIDGSGEGDVTVLEDGLWTFQQTITSDDPTLEGAQYLQGLGLIDAPMQKPFSWWVETIPLPAGAVFQFGINVTQAATENPFNRAATVSIARLM